MSESFLPPPSQEAELRQKTPEEVSAQILRITSALGKRALATMEGNPSEGSYEEGGLSVSTEQGVLTNSTSIEAIDNMTTFAASASSIKGFGETGHSVLVNSTHTDEYDASSRDAINVRGQHFERKGRLLKGRIAGSRDSLSRNRQLTPEDSVSSAGQALAKIRGKVAEREIIANEAKASDGFGNGGSEIEAKQDSRTRESSKRKRKYTVEFYPESTGNTSGIRDALLEHPAVKMTGLRFLAGAGRRKT